MENFFNEAKFFFNAKNQREFTLVTSEASFLSKFKLIFGIIKEFCWVKKFHFESVFHTTCSFLQHLSALFNFLYALPMKLKSFLWAHKKDFTPLCSKGVKTFLSTATFFLSTANFFCLLFFPLLLKKKLQQ